MKKNIFIFLVSLLFIFGFVQSSFAISAPTIISPAANAEGVGLVPTLSWSAVPEVTSDPDHTFYEVKVYTVLPNPAGLSWDVFVEAKTGTQIVYSGPSLIFGTKYSWCVNAGTTKRTVEQLIADGKKNSDGTFNLATGIRTDFSSISNCTPVLFETMLAPTLQNPVLKEPANSASSSIYLTEQGITFKWSNTGANFYKYEILPQMEDATTNITGIVAGSSNLSTDIQVTLGPNNFYIGNYKWRVRNCNAQACDDNPPKYSNNGTYWDFKTDLSTPTNLTPNGDTTSGAPILRWNKVPGSDGYELKIKMPTQNGYAPIYDSNVSGESFNVASLSSSVLINNTTYKWQVQAYKGSGSLKGTSLWSSEASFTYQTGAGCGCTSGKCTSACGLGDNKTCSNPSECVSPTTTPTTSPSSCSCEPFSLLENRCTTGCLKANQVCDTVVDCSACPTGQKSPHKGCIASEKKCIFLYDCGTDTCQDNASCGGTNPGPGGGGTNIICNSAGICNPLKAQTVQELIDIIAKFIFWIGIAVAPLMIIVAGFFYVTSAGDMKKIDTAKNIIMYTVIGLVIILLAKGLTSVLRGILGG